MLWLCIAVATTCHKLVSSVSCAASSPFSSQTLQGRTAVLLQAMELGSAALPKYTSWYKALLRPNQRWGLFKMVTPQTSVYCVSGKCFTITLNRQLSLSEWKKKTCEYVQLYYLISKKKIDLEYFISLFCLFSWWKQQRDPLKSNNTAICIQLSAKATGDCCLLGYKVVIWHRTDRG